VSRSKRKRVSALKIFAKTAFSKKMVVLAFVQFFFFGCLTAVMSILHDEPLPVELVVSSAGLVVTTFSGYLTLSGVRDTSLNNNGLHVPDSGDKQYLVNPNTTIDTTASADSIETQGI
jgi:hypothetical protein